MAGAATEILSIGNEILQGDVLDTNSHWLCSQLVSRAAQVTRITVIPDDLAIIAEALHTALARRPALIITCGGLGPTVDDLTLAAISTALDRPLAEDPLAYTMVCDFYAALHERHANLTAEITPARRKMAMLPAGGRPLANSVGAAPGVLLQEADTAIACLPGVPEEMEAIFAESLWPRLSATFGGLVFAERSLPTDCRDESLMAEAVNSVTDRHPDVYVKSRAQVYGGRLSGFVTLSTRAPSPVEAGALLDAAEADLRQALAAAGVKTYPAASASPDGP